MAKSFIQYKGEIMKTFCKKIWALLLFVPQFAIAATSSIPGAPDLSTKIFYVSPNDYSVQFLRRIFGNIGFGLSLMSTGEQTVFSGIFRVFNAGLLAISSSVVIFAIVKMFVESAHSGEFMGGQQKQSSWFVLRVVTGIGILVPSASGFSFLQAAVMWVVLQSIGFANATWISALNYLNTHGVIHSIYQEEDNKYNDISTRQIDEKLIEDQEDDSAVGAADIYRSLVCMHTVNTSILNELNATKRSYIDAGPLVPNLQAEIDKRMPILVGLINFFETKGLTYSFDSKTKMLKIPSGVPVKYRTDLDMFYSTKKKTVKYNELAGACGTFSWDVTSKNNQFPEKVAFYQESKRLALEEMVRSLDDMIYQTKIVDSSFQKTAEIESSTTTNDFDAELNTLSVALLDASTKYQNLVYEARNMAGPNNDYSSNEDKMAWIKEAQNSGWAMAGRYYYDLTKIYKVGLENKYYRASVDGNSFSPSTRNKNSPKYSIEQKILSILAFDVNKNAFKQGLTWANEVTDNAIVMAELLKRYNNSGIEDLTNSDFFASKEDFYSNLDTNQMWKDAFGDAMGGFKELDQELLGGNAEKVATGAYDTLFKNSIDKFKKTKIASATKNFFVSNIGLGDQISPIMNKHVNNVIDTWFSVMVNKDNAEDLTKNRSSPITNLSDLGISMVNEAQGIWKDIFAKVLNITITFATLQAAATAVSAAGIPLSGLPFGLGAIGVHLGTAGQMMASLIAAVQQISFSYLFLGMPLAIAVSGPLFVTGVTLSTYVPLIPFMLFTFGVISWLIFVIEAMTAAPLVALGFTHPQGHDFLGKAEQAIMLILGIFLRPICMVIGLITGIILSYIALLVLNAGFGGIVEAILGEPSAHPFQGIIMIVIYTFTVLALVNQCYALIHVIPDKIMRWIGFNAEQSGIEQLMEGVKQGATTFSQATADGAGRGVEGAKGDMAQLSGAISKVGPEAAGGIKKFSESGGVFGRLGKFLGK